MNLRMMFIISSFKGRYFLFLLGFPDCENFVLTKCNGSITDNSPLFGLDCEMVSTTFNVSTGGLQTRV